MHFTEAVVERRALHWQVGLVAPVVHLAPDGALLRQTALPHLNGAIHDIPARSLRVYGLRMRLCDADARSDHVLPVATTIRGAT